MQMDALVIGTGSGCRLQLEIGPARRKEAPRPPGGGEEADGAALAAAYERGRRDVLEEIARALGIGAAGEGCAK